MVYTLPLISKSSSPFTNFWVTVPRAPITDGITITFMFHSFFSVLKQCLSTYLSFRLPSVLLSGQPERQNPLMGKFSLFFIYIYIFDYHKVWSSGRDEVIGLYLKIPK